VELVTVGLSGWLVFTGEPHLVLVLGHGLPLKLRERFFPRRGRTSGGPLARVVLDSNELMDRLGVTVNTRYAARFPRGVHVNVVDVLDGGGLLRYRTWERAIDQETLACGSGALACAHVCRVRGLTTARRSTLFPYRCRCHRADAFLRVTDNPGGLVLEGNPRLVCSCVVPSGAGTDPADYPAERIPLP
jgi:diaminopimelate epimerase